eukprot:gnl/MRDRNA2_/MRDRNA2_85256_c0_seq1.p1 gnl/MRDRNA2_/MRDRNA2_85256_c0~~gnl/MRDRNA2_/MRDRNA2_85256_c0_seq1.p1  ORF type:complete len:223 (+),score=47.51 gnl/MRDRNA2_/MRDRNA2_85256_c0_seq1:139-807(+)
MINFSANALILLTLISGQYEVARGGMASRPFSVEAERKTSGRAVVHVAATRAVVKQALVIKQFEPSPEKKKEVQSKREKQGKIQQKERDQKLEFEYEQEAFLQAFEQQGERNWKMASPAERAAALKEEKEEREAKSRPPPTTLPPRPPSPVQPPASESDMLGRVPSTDATPGPSMELTQSSMSDCAVISSALLTGFFVGSVMSVLLLCRQAQSSFQLSVLDS